MSWENVQWNGDEISRKLSRSCTKLWFHNWCFNRRRGRVIRSWHLNELRRGNGWWKVRWMDPWRFLNYRTHQMLCDWGAEPSCWISPYCKLHDKCTGEQMGGERTSLFRTGGVRALKEMTSSCGSGLTPTHKGPNRLSSGIPHLTWLSFFQEAPSVGWIIKSVQQVYKAICNFTSVLTTTNKQEGYQGANNLTWLPRKCFPCFRTNVFMCTAAAVILLKTNPHHFFIPCHAPVAFIWATAGICSKNPPCSACPASNSRLTQLVIGWWTKERIQQQKRNIL